VRRTPFFLPRGSFAPRHNSGTPTEVAEMVAVTGFDSLDALIDATVPKAIRRPDMMDLGEYTSGMRESEFLKKFKCDPHARPARGPRAALPCMLPGRVALVGVPAAQALRPSRKPQPLLRCACRPKRRGARQLPTRMTCGRTPPWSVNDARCPACCPTRPAAHSRRSPVRRVGSLQQRMCLPRARARRARTRARGHDDLQRACRDTTGIGARTEGLERNVNACTGMTST